MPKLKSGHLSPTEAEDAIINAGIAGDPDNPEWTTADFRRAKSQSHAATAGKTPVTIRLDDDILDAFKARAAEAGTGYQTLINEALRAAIKDEERPITEDVLRRVLREELHHS